MIDTLTFVLHNINEKKIDLNVGTNGKTYRHGFNRALYERLCELDNHYVERTTKFYHDASVDNSDDNYFLSKIEKREGYVKRHGAIKENADRTEFYFYPVRGDFQTASSEYRTRFSVSENSDSILFELSVPKLIYNNNVAQFVPNVETRRYKNNIFGMREWYGQTKVLLQRINAFIVSFFNELSVMLSMPIMVSELDMKNVEIKRIDFCYNQFFPCHASVLDYLEGQRKVLKKVLNIRSKVDHYETSFAYKHADEGFYFKVYSKGEEFKVNDMQKMFKQNQADFDKRRTILMPIFKEIFKKHFPKIEKTNKGKTEDLLWNYYKISVESQTNNAYVKELENHLKHNISFIYAEANKILRYEMSFNRSYMSVIYKRMIFRKKCPHWKQMETAYKRVKQYDLYLSKNQPTKANAFKLKYLLSKKEFTLHQLFDRSQAKKHEFMLETTDELKHHESSAHKDVYKILSFNYKNIPEVKQATFSNDLLILMVNRFKKEIDALQLKKFDDVVNTLETIDAYNEKVKTNIERYRNLFGETNFKNLKHTEKRKKHLRQLNKPRLKIVLDKMAEGLSIDKIIEVSGISKSSKYELQKDLEIFNVFKSTVKTRFNHALIRTDFVTYYQRFYEDREYNRKLFPNPYLNAFDDSYLPMLHNLKTA